MDAHRPSICLDTKRLAGLRGSFLRFPPIGKQQGLRYPGKKRNFSMTLSIDGRCASRISSKFSPAPENA